MECVSNRAQNMSEEGFRNKIVMLSFTCALLVVLIHAYYTYSFFVETVPGIEESVPVLIQKIPHDIGHMYAVQIFFVISGFLLFRNLNGSTIKRKLHSRVRTVLVPYLMWNVLYTIAYYLLGNVLGLMGTIVDTTVWGLFESIFLYGTLKTFWYMFYLIICIAVSPAVLWFFGNKVRTIILWVAAISISFLKLPVGETTETAIAWYIFFLFGATAAYYFEDLVLKNITQKWGGRRKALFLTVSVLMCGVLPRLTNQSELSTIMCIILIWYCIDLIHPERDMRYKFMKKSFIIYAMHPLVCSTVQGVVRRILPQTLWTEIITYCGYVFIGVLLIIVIDDVALRLIPRARALLVGNR